MAAICYHAINGMHILAIITEIGIKIEEKVEFIRKKVRPFTLTAGFQRRNRIPERGEAPAK